MNAEKIFDVMENIDEQYIIEAHQKNVIKNKKKTIRKIVVFAACFSIRKREQSIRFKLEASCSHSMRL
jgi:hypothetical protein